MLYDLFVLYFYYYIIDVNFCVINNNCICFVLKGLKFNKILYDWFVCVYVIVLLFVG